MGNENFARLGNGSSTYGGNPLAIAAVYITMEVYKEEHLCENAGKLEKILGNWLECMKSKYGRIGQINYAGLYGVIDFVEDRKTKIPDNRLGLEVYKQSMDFRC